MSIKWMATVWEDAIDVEGTELLVLLAIADHAGDNGVSWPSVARLGKRARRAESTVQQALANLETRGWLRREFRSGQTTLYRLLVPRSQQTTPHQTPPVDQTPPVSGPPQPTGPEGSSVPDQGGPADRTQNRKRTTNEPDGVEETTSSNRAVTAQPFPAFAKAALDKAPPAEREEWSKAWDQVCATSEEWPPTLHLTKYLARCTETKRQPRPAEWLRWFAEDERKARSEGAASLPTDDTPQWWE